MCVVCVSERGRVRPERLRQREDMSRLRSFLSALSILCVRLLSADGQTGGADRIQVMFTPTICQVRCSQGRCLNSCERGNLTTLYSAGEAAAGRRDGGQSPSFRVCKCVHVTRSGAPEEPAQVVTTRWCH